MGQFDARDIFCLGSLPFISLGLLHGLLAVRDAILPRSFTPADDRVREAMCGTTLVLTDRTSVWLAWLGSTAWGCASSASSSSCSAVTTSPSFSRCDR